MRRKMVLIFASMIIASLMVVSGAVVATTEPATSKEVASQSTNLATNAGDDLRSLSTRFDRSRLPKLSKIQ